MSVFDLDSGRKGSPTGRPSTRGNLAYLALEPLLTSGTLDLLDEPTLLRELKGLERRAAPAGRP